MKAITYRAYAGSPAMTFWGRKFPSGMSSFSASIGNCVLSFCTDHRGRDAVRAARDYFRRINK